MKAKNIITKALLLGFVTSITKRLLTAISMFEISEVIYRCLLTLDLLCALGFGALLLVFVRNVENNKQMWTLVAVHAMGLVIGELLARLMFPLLQYIPLKNGYDQLLTSLRMFALPALYLLMVVIGLTCYTVVNRKKRKAESNGGYWRAFFIKGSCLSKLSFKQRNRCFTVIAGYNICYMLLL